jgi:hypothetical protein
MVDRSGIRQNISCHAAWVKISRDIEHRCYATAGFCHMKM